MIDFLPIAPLSKESMTGVKRRQAQSKEVYGRQYSRFAL
jgi:hypothetical protein